MNYSYNNVSLNGSKDTYAAAKQRYYSRTYGLMSAGLLVTFAAALLSALFLANIVFSPVVMTILCIAEFAIVIGFSAMLNRASLQTVRGMFFLYAVVNGMTLSSIYYAFDLQSITLCFFCAALAFGVMALFGARTDRDLSPVRGIFFAGFIAILILTIVSLFIGYTYTDILISVIGIVIFLGVTAYDSQKLGDMFDAAQGSEVAERYAVYAAMQLYLDFINLFLYMLRFMSNNKRRN